MWYVTNVTNGFDLGHDLDLEFLRTNMEFCFILGQNDPIAKKTKDEHYALGY